jgi:hypothetical protein
MFNDIVEVVLITTVVPRIAVLGDALTSISLG